MNNLGTRFSTFKRDKIMKEKKGERWGCDSSEGEQEEIWLPGGFADKIRLIIHTIDGSTFRFLNGFQPATIFPRLLRSSTGFYEGSYILWPQSSLVTRLSLSQHRRIPLFSTYFNFFFGLDRLGFFFFSSLSVFPLGTRSERLHLRDTLANSHKAGDDLGHGGS